MPRRPGREDTVHHVNPQSRVLGNLLGSSDAHQVARLVSRKVLDGSFYDFASHSPRFSDAQPSDGIAGKVNLDGPLSRFLPEREPSLRERR